MNADFEMNILEVSQAECVGMPIVDNEHLQLLTEWLI